jgi:cytochrome c
VNTANLNTFDLLVMFQTSGMVWDNGAQRLAAQSFLRPGRGIAAIHSTTGMEVDSSFAWWDDTVNGTTPRS